jgi:hypothetical protein
MSVDWRNFERDNALALAGAVRIKNNLAFSAGVRVGLNQSTVGNRAGFRMGW